MGFAGGAQKPQYVGMLVADVQNNDQDENWKYRLYCRSKVDVVVGWGVKVQNLGLGFWMSLASKRD